MFPRDLWYSWRFCSRWLLSNNSNHINGPKSEDSKDQKHLDLDISRDVDHVDNLPTIVGGTVDKILLALWRCRSWSFVAVFGSFLRVFDSFPQTFAGLLRVFGSYLQLIGSLLQIFKIISVFLLHPFNCLKLRLCSLDIQQTYKIPLELKNVYEDHLES